METEIRELTLNTTDANLDGILGLPAHASSLVVFVHGSGSSRFSSRNRQVASYLNSLGLATLLFDLLTERENETDRYTRQFRFDIPLLGRRIQDTVDWLAQEPDFASMRIGLFGASTGAAAALICAARRPKAIRAVVSRGGRPDLAGDDLDRVEAPTLLLVGGDDGTVIRLNEQAAKRLNCPHELSIIPGATHLFEEPGKLEQVSELGGAWFRLYLAAPEH
ncbi:dienelactone hydrolase family protein [Marinobacter caseinilyticus]|uniref:dienelactone hydrolase family protein n=1 Tax=Marinobacter caseinilyticus TaxID=2692195 RepID=UPI00140B64C2|nr:dienelactone hydrolase family protein [Marinobacter caseinilyticus]